MQEFTPNHLLIEIKDGTLHCLDWGGEGPPILLLHGLQDCAGNWDHISKSLSANFHVYALDSRGHGDSQHLPGKYRFEDYVSEIEEVIEALGLEHVTIVGHSAGGKYAFSYVAQDKHKAKNLVIIDMDPDQFNPGSASMFDRYHKEDDTWPKLEKVIQRISEREPRTSASLLKDQSIAMTRIQDDGTFIWKRDRSVLLEYERPDACDRLSRIKIRTLLMRGGDSQLLTQSVAEKMAKEIPTCDLVIVPNAGHWCYGENPEEFLQLLNIFLHDS